MGGSGNAYVTGICIARPYGNCFITKLTTDGDIDTHFPATYLGGVEYDIGNDVVVDQDGNILVVGTTYSDDFPTTAATFQPAIAPCPEPSSDSFVAKCSPTGAVIYVTSLGGMGQEQGNGIDVDVCGNAYVTGFTNANSMETCTDVFPQVNIPSYTATLGDCINEAFVTNATSRTRPLPSLWWTTSCRKKMKTFKLF